MNDSREDVGAVFLANDDAAQPLQPRIRPLDDPTPPITAGPGVLPLGAAFIPLGPTEPVGLGVQQGVEGFLDGGAHHLVEMAAHLRFINLNDLVQWFGCCCHFLPLHSVSPCAGCLFVSTRSRPLSKVRKISYVISEKLLALVEDTGDAIGDDQSMAGGTRTHFHQDSLGRLSLPVERDAGVTRMRTRMSGGVGGS